ncbi:MAG: 7-cyano-7-deazaguanine synthase QueC [Bacteroidetes bacterium GWF2_42_66]|nr:MAG: 7-cyano-7-deazaguanine synthase QueC [Bacteroidetes bacterium GWA2_42_15]OFX96498.1 MAG: 7-cyano-7-deazaguanine synthase QueC [Bacteroidetes bacterium GWE2_42_39]OFY40918.1 MAG: 7-cyano-7-deazaguanine synthase QueC [Bacteroidetes bacterium GWF2_42_66]HBL76353.1 7-cyano-7-deazaguanine synthase QueC [Prolixibacteraceae bacterium]HCR92093.1 7-cyano-7-deazaguanine synthase QueC [Prolixibacteraceae bacterium]
MIGDKALVVFSGGQDSSTCLFWAKKHFAEVFAIAFNYGQRHKIELEAAKNIAKRAGVQLQIFKIDLLSQLTENALTSQQIEIEKEKPADRPPNTLVEGRNMLFLTYAAIFAKANGINHLVTGVGQADFSGYPDCRNDFILSLNQTLNLSMDIQYTIHTPLMWKNKAEIWQLADELGVFDLVRNETVTCYNGIKGAGCGECPACILRNRGLEMYLKTKNV